jgi:hypothetical protein
VTDEPAVTTADDPNTDLCTVGGVAHDYRPYHYLQFNFGRPHVSLRCVWCHVVACGDVSQPDPCMEPYHHAYRMSEPLLAALAEEEARAARAEGEQPSGYMSQREWEDWSNEVADLLPEHYDGDEAQESIILHAVADMAAALWLIVTPSSQPSKPCGMNGLRGPVRCQLATWATLSTALCRCR